MPLDADDQARVDEGLREAAHLGQTGILVQNAADSQKLGPVTVGCTILNRTIGSGIYVTPAIVLKSTNSVGISLLLWAFGAVAGNSALLVWLELGLSIPKFEVADRDAAEARPEGETKLEPVPRNGGEKNYLCAVSFNQRLEAELDMATVFFREVFGNDLAPRVMSGIIAFSIFGNIVVMTFTASRVKQEIAKEGVLPFSLFFARSTTTPIGRLVNHFWPSNLPDDHLEESPAPALFLHWIFAMIMIGATSSTVPSVAYDILVSLYSYTVVVLVGFFVASGLLYLRFFSEGKEWTSGSGFKPWGGPTAAIIYSVTCAFLLVAAFLPPSAGSYFAKSSTGLEWYIVPTVGLGTLLLGYKYYLTLELKSIGKKGESIKETKVLILLIAAKCRDCNAAVKPSTSAAVVRRSTTIAEPSFTVTNLGLAYDSKAPSMGRDGGGGNVLNNQNWAVFSDTELTDPFQWGGSNSFGQSSSDDPTVWTDVLQSNGAPVPAIPWAEGEDPSKSFIWPSTSFATRTRDSTTGWGVYTFGNRTSNGDGISLYETLCRVTSNATTVGLNFERVIPKFMFEGEQPSFGRFSNVYDASDDKLIMMDPKAHILKVPYDAAADPSQYTYYAGGDSTDYTTNVADAAPLHEAYENTPISGSMCGMATGDLFYSPHLATWAIIYQTTCCDSKFWIRWSLSGVVEGPWSGQTFLYLTPGQGTCADNKYSDSGHAYATWLGDDAKSVILTWYDRGENAGRTAMARVDFA
ncbi:hypothetical protein P7C71_g4203, partial [Lecanoromycetidae sp. Uapishka_2]